MSCTYCTCSMFVSTHCMYKECSRECVEKRLCLFLWKSQLFCKYHSYKRRLLDVQKNKRRFVLIGLFECSCCKFQPSLYTHHLQQQKRNTYNKPGNTNQPTTPTTMLYDREDKHCSCWSRPRELCAYTDDTSRIDTPSTAVHSQYKRWTLNHNSDMMLTCNDRKMK